MIKIIVLILIISISGIIGNQISSLYKTRTILLFDFVNFCNAYNANLEFFQNELEDFVKSFCESASKEFNIITSEKLQLNLLNSNKNIKKNFFSLLTKEQDYYVNNFFSVLGKSDSISQKTQISTYSCYFNKELENAKFDYEKKGKIFSKLGILFGVFLSILVI